jgi:hypothetical protein
MPLFPHSKSPSLLLGSAHRCALTACLPWSWTVPAVGSELLLLFMGELTDGSGLLCLSRYEGHPVPCIGASTGGMDGLQGGTHRGSCCISHIYGKRYGLVITSLRFIDQVMALIR